MTWEGIWEQYENFTASAARLGELKSFTNITQLFQGIAYTTGLTHGGNRTLCNESYTGISFGYDNMNSILS